MSVEITVSWRFVTLGSSHDQGSQYVRFAEKARRDETSTIKPAPDRVLPLGSSVVAPGLAVFMPG